MTRSTHVWFPICRSHCFTCTSLLVATLRFTHHQRVVVSELGTRVPSKARISTGHNDVCSEVTNRKGYGSASVLFCCLVAIPTIACPSCGWSSHLQASTLISIHSFPLNPPFLSSD